MDPGQAPGAALSEGVCPCVLCSAWHLSLELDPVSLSGAGGSERRRVSLSCKSLCSVKPFADAALLPVSPANFPIISTPSEGLEKNLFCPILLLKSLLPHLLPLHFVPTPPVHPALGMWLLPSQLAFAGDCRVNGEIKFHCCF